MVVPLHLHGNHWTVACTRISTKWLDDRLVSFETTSDYDDGLRGLDGTFILGIVTRWLNDEFEDKQRRKPNPAAKHTIASINKGPAQCDGWNCGVQALQTARLRVAGVPLSFTSVDMPYFRKRIVLEILSQHLLDSLSAHETAADGSDFVTLAANSTLITNHGGGDCLLFSLNQALFDRTSSDAAQAKALRIEIAELMGERRSDMFGEFDLEELVTSDFEEVRLCGFCGDTYEDYLAWVIQPGNYLGANELRIKDPYWWW